MKPKIKDVAKVAGVSPTTVSRVLNDRGYISETTRKSVYDAMHQLNYIPNDLARSLFNQRTHVIGLIVPTTSNPFYGELTAAIENYCSAQGLKVLLCNSLNRVDKEKQYWEMLRRNQVDGVIVGTYNRGLLDYDGHNLPIVAIDHYLSKAIPVVGSDNYAGGKLATETLLSKGCKHVLHVNGPLELETPANLRRKAYEDVMAQNGLPHVTYEVPHVFDRNEQERVIKKMFDEHPDVDGVFASDDLMALAVIREARKRRLSIPKELKVIGYDGTEMVRTVEPELSTICQPISTIAETSVTLLQKQIEAPEKKTVRETWHEVEVFQGGTV
ncbi:LacI family DNA-binding transcriptional regulator [Shouchella shacheensis]|uniref:LacI family DNA-binding transcriptional regulator n=1 Tax=Shouchella shacheensis TaxID=1649580 RepID=UPI00073FB845|nr:LacI family DNA-binding transcriptional regulator [Shouchella shacheensis]